MLEHLKCRGCNRYPNDVETWVNDGLCPKCRAALAEYEKEGRENG